MDKVIAFNVFIYYPMTGHFFISRPRLHQIGDCNVLPKVQALVKTALKPIFFYKVYRSIVETVITNVLTITNYGKLKIKRQIKNFCFME